MKKIVSTVAAAVAVLILIVSVRWISADTQLTGVTMKFIKGNVPASGVDVLVSKTVQFRQDKAENYGETKPNGFFKNERTGRSSLDIAPSTYFITVSEPILSDPNLVERTVFQQTFQEGATYPIVYPLEDGAMKVSISAFTDTTATLSWSGTLPTSFATPDAFEVSVENENHQEIKRIPVMQTAGKYMVTGLSPRSSYTLLLKVKKGTSLYYIGRDMSTKLPKCGINQVTDASKTVTGTSLDGTYVQVMVGSKVIGSDYTAPNGQFTVAIPKQKADTTISVVAMNEEGDNTYKSVATTKKVLDKTPPTISGVKNKGFYNKTVKITFKEGKITLDGKKIKSGKKVSKAGKHKIIAVDSKNNVGTTIFTIDKTKPKVARNLKAGTKLLSGKAEKNATVTVYQGKKKIGSAKVSAKGSFAVKYSKKKWGTSLTVFVTDRAKNKSKAASVKVK